MHGFLYPPSRLEILDGQGARQQADSDARARARGAEGKAGGGGSGNSGGESSSSSSSKVTKKEKKLPRSTLPPPPPVVRGVLGVNARVTLLASRLELEVGVVGSECVKMFGVCFWACGRSRTHAHNMR